MEQGIFTLEEVAIIGELGTGSQKEEPTFCNTCKIERPPITFFNSIEYVFDIWFGEDIIGIEDYHLISERLKIEFEKNEIKGVKYLLCKHSKSSIFQIEDLAYQNDLPSFFLLIPDFTNAQANSPIYSSKGICKSCNGPIWSLKEGGLDYLLGFETDVDTLEIYKDSDKGYDYFFSEWYPRPIVTNKFRKIVQRFNHRQAVFKPAIWI